MAPGAHSSSVFAESGIGARITDVRANVDIDELHIVRVPGTFDDHKGMRMVDASSLVAGTSELQ